MLVLLVLYNIRTCDSLLPQHWGLLVGVGEKRVLSRRQMIDGDLRASSLLVLGRS